MAAARQRDLRFVVVAGTRCRRGLVFSQVFERHVVLQDLFCVHFFNVFAGCFFHAVDRFGLEGLPLLDQFFDALRARLGDVRQALSVAGLSG